MMFEDKEKEAAGEVTEEKYGLSPSDVEDHNVDDGVQDGIVFDTAEEAADEEKADEEKKAKRRVRRRLVFAFLLGAAVCLTALAGAWMAGLGHLVSDEDYNYYKELDAGYGKYYEIMKMIGEDPIAETDPQELSDAELKEIVASIGDPYAEYYTKEEYAEIQKRYLGDYVGIGIGIVDVDGDIVIMTVFEGTPAEKAGIQPEDIILKVDGKEPSSVDDAIDMISGEAGTEVTVTLKRGDEVLDFTLTRERIETESVGYTALDGEHSDIGYISISSFIKSTDEDFKDAVEDLRSQGCDKFIIDLRDNGGGLTESSIEIADYLLPECRIMSENTKDGTETVYNSKDGSEDLDMVILVNGNTASASEILAAALQDNKACTVIGTKTYGKGVTQTLRPFDDGTAVKITVTEYFRPNGKTVQGVGITPDIEAEGDDALDAAIMELED